MDSKTRAIKAENGAADIVIGLEDGGREAPYKHPLLDEAKVANVRQFLKLLHQIGGALRDLGYDAEGDVLAQVKADLQQRILWTSEARIGAPTIM